MKSPEVCSKDKRNYVRKMHSFTFWNEETQNPVKAQVDPMIQKCRKNINLEQYQSKKNHFETPLQRKLFRENKTIGWNSEIEKPPFPIKNGKFSIKIENVGGSLGRNKSKSTYHPLYEYWVKNNKNINNNFRKNQPKLSVQKSVIPQVKKKILTFSEIKNSAKTSKKNLSQNSQNLTLRAFWKIQLKSVKEDKASRNIDKFSLDSKYVKNFHGLFHKYFVRNYKNENNHADKKFEINKAKVENIVENFIQQWSNSVETKDKNFKDKVQQKLLKNSNKYTGRENLVSYVSVKRPSCNRTFFGSSSSGVLKSKIYFNTLKNYKTQNQNNLTYNNNNNNNNNENSNNNNNDEIQEDELNSLNCNNSTNSEKITKNMNDKEVDNDEKKRKVTEFLETVELALKYTEKIDDSFVNLDDDQIQDLLVSFIFKLLRRNN